MKSLTLLAATMAWALLLTGCGGAPPPSAQAPDVPSSAVGSNAAREPDAISPSASVSPPPVGQKIIRVTRVTAVQEESFVADHKPPPDELQTHRISPKVETRRGVELFDPL
jgi:hypothetical protein